MAPRQSFAGEPNWARACVLNFHGWTDRGRFVFAKQLGGQGSWHERPPALDALRPA